MAEAEQATEGDARDEESAGGSVTLTVSGRTVTIGLPPDADESEAAAIATAVGAHLQDRARAAAASGQDDDRRERADPWTLAGRMKAMGRRRWPDDVRRDEEWAAASRSFY